jgi:hypothetical protein
MSAAPTAVRASFSAVAHRRAIPSAAFSRLGVNSARRNVFSSTPVFIWTGHAIAQVPSAAQVSMPHSVLNGAIRVGRDLATRQRILRELSQMWTRLTGQPEEELLISLWENRAENVMEGGSIFPEIGQERSAM